MPRRNREHDRMPQPLHSKASRAKLRAPRCPHTQLWPFSGDVSTPSCRAALSRRARGYLRSGTRQTASLTPQANPKGGRSPSRSPGQSPRRRFPPTVRRKVAGGRRGSPLVCHTRPADGFLTSSPLRLRLPSRAEMSRPASSPTPRPPQDEPARPVPAA